MTAEQRAQFSETLRTVVVAKSKGGRPKIGAAPMTGAERARRARAKRKAKA